MKKLIVLTLLLNTWLMGNYIDKKNVNDFCLKKALNTTKRWYKPTSDVTWFIQLEGSLKKDKSVDIYDVDLFDTSKEDISKLHQKGKKVICYFSAGSYEDWREDSVFFPKNALGNKLEGWESERWLDIRNSALKYIMTKRMDYAKNKGCDGVDPDNVDGYENKTGFILTYYDQLNYNKFLAIQAHKRGLSIGLKNNLDQINVLKDYYDFAINEQCNIYNECKKLKPFISQNKPVLNIEYRLNYKKDEICRDMSGSKIMTIFMQEDILDGNGERCRKK